MIATEVKRYAMSFCIFIMKYINIFLENLNYLLKVRKRSNMFRLIEKLILFLKSKNETYISLINKMRQMN